MRNYLLIGSGLLLAGLLVSKMNNFLDNLQVHVRIKGLPTFANGFMELPIELRMDNPERESFKVTQIYCKVYERQADGSWKAIASSNPAMPVLIIKPASSTYHTLKISMPVQDTALNVLFKVLDYTATRKLPSLEDYRVKGHLEVEGVKLPFDSYSQKTLAA